MPALAHVLTALLFVLIPAQTRQVASGISIQTGEACSGLNDQECCGQMLEYAGFRALGEHLPRKVSTTVKLACMSDEITSHACRSIVATRGFASTEVDAACKPATARRDCHKNGTCRQCTQDLRKLAYKESHHVCHAVTYQPKKKGPGVVVLRSGSAEGDGDAVEITRRRTRIQ
jgi:hypothetical protein